MATERVTNDKPGTSRQVTADATNWARYNPGHTTITFTTEEGPAPAWYHQLTGDVVISLRFLDAVSDDVLVRLLSYPMRRGVTAEWAAKVIPGTDKTAGTVLGIVQHEIAHSRWSRWIYENHDNIRSLTDRPDGVFRLIQVWDEVRIEKRAYDADRGTRIPLRHSFGYLLSLLEEQTPETKADVSILWALTVGRSHAGVVEPDEVQSVNDLARTLIGDYEVDVLHEILDEVVSLHFDDLTRKGSKNLKQLVALAEEWLDLVGVTSEGTFKVGVPNEDADGKEKAEAGGSPGEGDDDGEEGEEGEAGGKGGDSESDGGEGGIDGRSDPKEGTEYKAISDEDAERLLEAIKNATTEIGVNAGELPKVRTADPRELADKVFGQKTIATGHAWGNRAPRPDERQAVTSLANAISRISYDAPAVRKVATAVPPGRIRSREAVRRSADRAAGRMTTAQPWETKKRRHTHNPPITLGLMTDTSGSMSWAQEVVASAAYIFANAVTRSGGRVAAVTFGDKAEAVVRPGEIPTTVRSRRADGGSEAFDHAAAALDGTLHLSDGRGARVLVIFSDGALVNPGEPEKAVVWMDRMHRSGAAIVWINRGNAKPHYLPSYVEFVGVPSAYTTEFKSITTPIADAMERAFRSARF